MKEDQPHLSKINSPQKSKDKRGSIKKDFIRLHKVSTNLIKDFRNRANSLRLKEVMIWTDKT